MLPHLSRCHLKMFRKHPSEQFIIRKSMAFQDIFDRIICRNNILVNVRKPQFILIFQKCDSHAFFEETAEIPGLQIGNSGDFFNADMAVIIFPDIVQDRVQSYPVFVALGLVSVNDADAEVVISWKRISKSRLLKRRMKPSGRISLAICIWIRVSLKISSFV